MVENYLGEETFRRGVHNYLAAHMYGNATAEDFWGAQTAQSKKPIDKIMGSFVAQPGVPILTFQAPQDGSVSVSQQRFFLSPSAKAEGAQTWNIPVCMKAGDGSKDCQVLSSAQQSLKAPQAPFFFADAEGKGYYRSSYPPEAYAKIVSSVETGLKPEERISLLGDAWAQVRADKMAVGDYLNLAAAVKDDANASVIVTALSAVDTIDMQIAATPEEHEALAAWVRKNFKPAYQQLGAASDSDTPGKKQLRATLFGYLGLLGEDPDVIAEAKQTAEKYLADSSSVEATFAQTAIAIAAAHGDAAFFDQLQKTFETSENPQLQESALRMLADFKDQSLEHRALDYTVSGKVRNQDAAIEFLLMLRGTETRDLAWQYIQQNWDKVQAQLTTSMGAYLISGTGFFCSADVRDQVTSFFATHKVAASERALARAKNQINDCIELRSAQEPKLKEWIATQK
jgi:aminopeptidase N/puromycin-sensitive aminopeptidase